MKRVVNIASCLMASHRPGSSQRIRSNLINLINTRQCGQTPASLEVMLAFRSRRGLVDTELAREIEILAFIS